MKAAGEFGADPNDMVSLCALRAGTGLFGIDTSQIREVLGAIAPQRVPLAPKFIAGVVPYRGEVLTTVSLRVLLGLDGGPDAGCVLVLDDGDTERFGLMVDGVGGVMTMARGAFEANPSAVDSRGATLLDGVYRTQSTLMVRLDPQRLRPSYLSQSGLPGTAKPENRKYR
jgi:purine-binding chemotaxis protein CheW